MKKLAKAALKEAVKPASKQTSAKLSWEQIARRHKGDCAFFYRLSDDDPWSIAVPESLLHGAKEQKRRKSAKSLEIEDIYDADELAERKQDIKDDVEHDYPREDYDSDAKWQAEKKAAIKEGMDELAAEIKWSDMMIIVPIRKRDGDQFAVAVREKDAQNIGHHHLYPDQDIFLYATYSRID